MKNRSLLERESEFARVRYAAGEILVIEVDFHVHSKYSHDSFLNPRLIVETAKRKGLSAVAITDHNTIKGVAETVREASLSGGLVVVPGIEVRTNIGDITGLWVEREIQSRSLLRVVDEIKKQDGIVVLPHPFRGHKNLKNEMLSKIDVVETLNGRASREDNLRAKELALSLGKPVIGGSDAHFAFEIGCVRTVLSGAATDLEELRKSIINGEGRVVGQESPFFVHILSFSAQILKNLTG